MFAFCLGAAAGADAQQRPLVTEDPETIGADRILLEGGVSFDKSQTNSANGLKGDITRLASFGVSIGLSPTAEVQVDGGLVQQLDVNQRIPTAPLVNSTSLVPGDTASSFEDFIIATKIRLASEGESRPALGLRFGTKLPTAAEDKGIGLGTTDFFASFLVAKTVQSVRTVGNVGLFVLGNPDEQDAATALGFGVSVARALTNEFEVVGEVNGRLTPFEKIVPPGLESRGVFRLAGRYTYAMLRLDVGVVAGFTDRDPGVGIAAGATYMITR
ncbi:MAG: hypothetical protein EHM55_03135 [Acidobacteria bacterium]|nr:MAG: hypothetical protein EHM55_03135 [Acidobacteriota bacterium]